MKRIDLGVHEHGEMPKTSDHYHHHRKEKETLLEEKKTKRSPKKPVRLNSKKGSVMIPSPTNEVKYEKAYKHKTDKDDAFAAAKVCVDLISHNLNVSIELD